MHSMCFRLSVFLSSQRMKPCHTQLQRERQAKLLIYLHQDLKQSRGLQCIWNVFQSQMQPTTLPLLFIQQQRLLVQQRQCQQFVLVSSSAAWRNTRVSAFFVGASTHTVQVYFCGWWDHVVTASGNEYCAWNLIIIIFLIQFLWKEKQTGHSFLIVVQEALPGGRYGAKGSTLRRWLWPHLLLVLAFKLSAR